MARYPSIDFAFDEVAIQMPNGETLYVTGEMPVEYHICPSEPDVGIFRSYAEAWAAHDFVEVEGFTMAMDDCGPNVRITIPTDLIVSKCSERIEQQCMDEASEPEYERDYYTEAKDRRMEGLA